VLLALLFRPLYEDGELGFSTKIVGFWEKLDALKMTTESGFTEWQQQQQRSLCPPTMFSRRKA
jgi:hypothetical protein